METKSMLTIAFIAATLSFLATASFMTSTTARITPGTPGTPPSCSNGNNQPPGQQPTCKGGGLTQDPGTPPTPATNPTGFAPPGQNK